MTIGLWRDSIHKSNVGRVTFVVVYGLDNAALLGVPCQPARLGTVPRARHSIGVEPVPHKARIMLTRQDGDHPACPRVLSVNRRISTPKCFSKGLNLSPRNRPANSVGKMAQYVVLRSTEAVHVLHTVEVYVDGRRTLSSARHRRVRHDVTGPRRNEAFCTALTDDVASPGRYRPAVSKEAAEEGTDTAEDAAKA